MKKIYVNDTILGRDIALEHAIDLIVWNETEILEDGDFKGVNSADAEKEITNNLNYYLEKHNYEYIKNEKVKEV